MINFEVKKLTQLIIIMNSVNLETFVQESYVPEEESNGNPDLVSFYNISEIFP